MLNVSRFGPNTFPAHNSVLFASEVQVEYITRTMITPLLYRRARTVEVKEAAEHQWVNNVDHQLQGTVFQAGCSNWYINKNGRNSASWPGYAALYWLDTLLPHRGALVKSAPSPTWLLNMLKRWASTMTVRDHCAAAAMLMLAWWTLAPLLPQSIGSS